MKGCFRVVLWIAGIITVVVVGLGLIAGMGDSSKSTSKASETANNLTDAQIVPLTATSGATNGEEARPVLVQIATAPVVEAPTAAPVIEAPTTAPAILNPTATAAPVAPEATAIPRTYANQEGNLRAGPGTEFEIAGNVAAGEPVEVLYKNPAGDWYQLGNGAWIAAFLVSGLSADLPVAPLLPAAPVVVEVAPVVEQPVVQEQPVVEEQPASVDSGGGDCDPSYPDVCIPPKSRVGDLNCPDIPQFANFRVLAPDPHGFDKEHDGWGCENN